MRTPSVAVAALLSCACADQAAVGPNPIELAAAVGEVVPCVEVSEYAYSGFRRMYPCNTTVKVSSDPADSSAVNAAVRIWQNALPYSVATQGALRIQPGSSAGSWTVENLTAATDQKCGETDQGARKITIKPLAVLNCSNPSQDLKSLMVHELAHAVGFTSLWHLQNLPDNCATRLLPGGGHNGGPCQHELELIYAAYGYTDIDENALSAFFSSRIATGLVLSPSSVSIEEGGSDTVHVTGTRFARQLGASQTTTVPNVAWDASNDFLTLTPLQGLTAVRAGSNDAGSYSMFGRITGGTGTRIGAWAKLVGTEVPVSVAAGSPTPPPPVPLKVVAIGIQGATPITVAGNKGVSAWVSGDNGQPVSIRWQITWSNGVVAPKDFVTSTLYTSFPVPGGSYNISIKATPKFTVGSPWGISRTEDFPVCTSSSGGGQNLMAVPGGGATPTAVEGC